MSPTYTRLVADIGGTNARFAVTCQDDPQPRRVSKLATAEFPDLVSATRTYLKQLDESMPQSMCIAVAGPTGRDKITLTNNSWSFSVRDIQQQLAMDTLRIINDFEAMAWAVSSGTPEDCQQIGGTIPAPGKPVAVIGPGTGFGAAQLLFDAQGRPMVVATEGGHASLAPCNERELAVFRWLLQRGIYPSRESLLSGSGLETLYRALIAIDQTPRQALSAADIQQSAVNSDDAYAHEALSIFCALLGTAAGDQVLCCGALGGLYITGGIVRRFLPFLQQSTFRQRFEQHGAMQHYLAPLPVFVVTAHHQGLKGAATVKID